jgi:predicted nucleic acid-binding protein
VKILFDTNVILDVLLDREPFSNIAFKLMSMVELKKIEGYLSATTITTIFYLASKLVGKIKAGAEVNKLLTLFEIAPINKLVLKQALNLRFTDFEDAVLYEAAKQSDLHGIVTRNIKDFKKATISVYSPEELYNMVQSIVLQSR